MRVRRLACGLLLAAVAVWPITAQQQSVTLAPISLARLDVDASRIVDFGSDLHIELGLSRPVQWRAFTLDAPRRLVLDFGEVDFTGGDLTERVQSDVVTSLRAGPFGEDWSRLVIELSEPLRIDAASLAPVASSGLAALKLQLAPTDAEDFARMAGEPESVHFTRDPILAAGDGGDVRAVGEPLHVALDAGHGGLDPGVISGGLSEAEVILDFTRDLSDALRAANMEVSMVREADVYVPLADRVAMAESADVLLSIHANTEDEGHKSGATVYTLAAEPTDEATASIAHAHDHADLLAGSDSTVDGFAAAGPLVRADTDRRSDALADALVLSLARKTGDLRKRPHRRADFAVLRAVGTPSVLLELGLLSSAGDRANLHSDDWRASAIEALRDALMTWAAGNAGGERLAGE